MGIDREIVKKRKLLCKNKRKILMIEDKKKNVEMIWIMKEEVEKGIRERERDREEMEGSEMFKNEDKRV